MASTTRYEISHVSRYLYASPVRGCVMSLCLKPRDEPGQRLLRFEIATNPLSSMNSETDCFGNTKHVLNIHREHEALEIVALSAIETAATAPPSGSLGVGSWEEVRSWRDSLAYWDFMHASALARPSARLKDFVDRMDIRAAGDPLEALTGLSDALHRGFEYVPGSTSVASSIDHVLENGRGVCQDYSHVMIAIARSWGVPSRYVSGYGPVDASGPASVSASHAWVECLLPGLGWTGFDPTNGCLPGESHVRVAVGRDYQDVAPTRGVLLGGRERQLEVEVRMRPMELAPGIEDWFQPGARPGGRVSPQ